MLNSGTLQAERINVMMAVLLTSLRENCISKLFSYSSITTRRKSSEEKVSKMLIMQKKEEEPQLSS